MLEERQRKVNKFEKYMKISTQSFFIVPQSLLTYLGYNYLFRLCYLKMKITNKQLEASVLLILLMFPPNVI